MDISDLRAITNPNLQLSFYFEYFIYTEMSTMQLKNYPTETLAIHLFG